MMKILFLKLLICMFGLMLSLLSAGPILNAFENERIVKYNFHDMLKANYFFAIWGFMSGLYLFTILSPFVYGKKLRAILFTIFIFSQLAIFASWSDDLFTDFRTLANALPNILAVGFVLKWNFDARSTH
jgi:hypothetical protein